MKTLLVAKNLSKNFLGIVAVSNASIRVDEGEIVSIIGPNGAGKTTLLNLLSGVIRPSSGSVEFEGQIVTHLGPHQYAGLGITRTFQNLALFKVGRFWIISASAFIAEFNPAFSHPPSFFRM